MSQRDISSSGSTDPTARIANAEAALSLLTSESERTERLATLGTIAAGIAHEINNLLTPVLAYAQLAAAHPHDDDLRAKALDKTISGIESATRIAGAVLGFASSEGENDSNADVGSVVNATLDCLAYDPNKDRIQITTEVLPGTYVRMSSLCLQQVLMNLIINAKAALEESGAGRPRRVTVAAITRADGCVGIRVSDNGPGIPKEIAGRIFEPFVTTKRPTDGRSKTGRAASGTGLGLSICRRLVEQAGGTITAMSKPGDGTTFVISLPSSKAHRAKAG
jgi:signal transduction histidine kinase